MNDRLENLYQETILEHNKHPKNFKKLEKCSSCAHGVNQLCGDDYYVYLNLDKNNIITDISFQGVGCAISKSSASLMTTLIKGKTREEALNLKECFINMLTQNNCAQQCKTCLGSLKLFESVKKFPVRVKCATLIWRALEKALTTTSKPKGEGINQKGDQK
jgi:nitrogen fixation protein NifU and related proteins